MVNDTRSNVAAAAAVLPTTTTTTTTTAATLRDVYTVDRKSHRAILSPQMQRSNSNLLLLSFFFRKHRPTGK